MGVGRPTYINIYCIYTRKTPMHFLLQDPSPFRLRPHHPPPFNTIADIPTTPGTSPLTLAPSKQCRKEATAESGLACKACNYWYPQVCFNF